MKAKKETKQQFTTDSEMTQVDTNKMPDEQVVSDATTTQLQSSPVTVM